MPFLIVDVVTASYEQLKRLLLADGHTELDTVSRLTCGALAGIASVITTYPLDIARTRLSVLLTTTEDTRTRSGGKMSERQPASHTGRRQLKPTLVNVVLDIYRHEHGVFGLYRGLVPTLLVGNVFGDAFEAQRRRTHCTNTGALTALITAHLMHLYRRTRCTNIRAFSRPCIRASRHT